MKIFILINPQDYTDADAVVFRTRQEAEDEKERIAREYPYKRKYLRIQEEEV